MVPQKRLAAEGRRKTQMNDRLIPSCRLLFGELALYVCNKIRVSRSRRFFEEVTILVIVRDLRSVFRIKD